MGLAILGLVMEIEETFGIVIRDEEIDHRDLKVGNLHSIVIKELSRVGRLSDDAKKRDICPNLVVFNKIRRVLMQSFDIPREKILLDSMLEDFIPINNRKIHWSRFEKALGYQIPRLVPPQPIPLILSILQFSLLLIATVMFFTVNRTQGYASEIWLPATIFSILLALTVLAMNQSESRSINIHHTSKTMTTLVKHIVYENWTKIQNRSVWTKQDVWQTLCIIIERHADYPRHLVHNNTSLRDDLSLD